MKMKLTKLALALAACGACAALPAAAQNPYYSNDSRYSGDYRDSNDARYYGDQRDAPSWRDRDADWRDRGTYRDENVARVLDVQPVAGSGQREECWNTHTNAYEEVRGPEKARIASKDTSIGAVAGGVIGHQFGNHGAAGTIGGALLGGLAGHAYEQHRDNEASAQDDLDRSRCRVADSGANAYDVRYQYQGREYVARMDHQPNATLVPGRDIADDGQPYQSGSWDNNVR